MSVHYNEIHIFVERERENLSAPIDLEGVGMGRWRKGRGVRRRGRGG